MGCATSVTWQVGETMTPDGRVWYGLLPPQLASRPGASVAEAAVGRLDSGEVVHGQQILSAANNFAKGGIFSVRWRFITVKITQRLPSAERAEPADTR